MDEQELISIPVLNHFYINMLVYGSSSYQMVSIPQGLLFQVFYFFIYFIIIIIIIISQGYYSNVIYSVTHYPQQTIFLNNCFSESHYQAVVIPKGYYSKIWNIKTQPLRIFLNLEYQNLESGISKHKV